MSGLEGMPSWPPPYPDHNRGPVLLRTIWSLISLSTAVVIVRVWTKLTKTRRLYADDLWMILAVVFGLVHTALMSKGIESGLGRHTVYLTREEIQQTLKFGVLGLGWGFLSPMAGRISFCMTMLYLTGTDRRLHRWAKYVTVAFMILQAIINVLAFIAFYAQCGTHLDIFWTPSRMAEVTKYCMAPKIQTDLGYFQGTFNCITDAYLTVLPGILIEHSKLSIKRKIGLACLLCLSVLGLTAAIVKTYEAKALSQVLDYSYDLFDYAIWISVELNVVIVASSIPLLRPLLDMFHKKHQRLPDEPAPDWDTTTFGSRVSKSKSRTRTKALSTSSVENIVPQDSRNFRMEQPGITVTQEVEVTYQVSDVQFVHAALVGLVQGEIANPRLARG